MTSNPLEDDPDRNQRIKTRAYYLWQHDGEPNGADLDYWERARALIALEDSAGAGQLRVPDEVDQEAGAGRVVEEASIQENLGEFPDRLADQGERAPTPKISLRKSDGA